MIINYANLIIAGGTADAMTATISTPTLLQIDLLPMYIRVVGPNATTTPTLTLNNGSPFPIVKGTNDPLAIGDMQDVAAISLDLANSRWVLLNPQTTSGVGSQDLETTLGVGASTGGIPITSPDGEKNVTVDDSIAKLEFTGGIDNGYSQFAATDGLAQMAAGDDNAEGSIGTNSTKTRVQHDLLLEIDSPSVRFSSSTANRIVTTNGSKDFTTALTATTDGTLAGNSDTNIPSEKAVKTYVDTSISTAAVGLLDDQGNFTPSGTYPIAANTNPVVATIKKGFLWTISGLGVGVTGTMGTKTVTDGDVVRALSDSPGQTESNWAIAENNFGYTAENQANKTDTVASNEASTSKYLSVKGYYDYLVALTWFTAARLGDLIFGLTAKTTPVDADSLVISDSEASDDAKKVSLTSFKTFLKVYNDTLYAPLVSQLRPTAVKASSYTAAPGDYIPCDTTSGVVPITLPTAPADGTIIGIKRVVGTTNNVTYTCGGSDVLNVSGGSTSGSLQILNQQVTLIYKATVAIWYVETSLSITGIDAIINSKYAVASGTDTYTVTISPSISAYTTGQTFRIKIQNTNTVNNPTLNANSLGAKTIVGANGSNIPIGLLMTNGNYDFTYDGTNMVLQAGIMDRRDISYFRKTGTSTYERWYSNNVNGIALSTGAFAKDLLRAIPIVIPKNVTVDRIGIEITAGGTAGSVVRLGIYEDLNLVPNNLIIDAGTIAGDSATFQSITINQALRPGLYWLAYIHNSTANITFRITPVSGVPVVLGLANVIGSNPCGIGVQSTLTYTTLPSTFTATPSVLTAAQPTIAIRIA